MRRAFALICVAVSASAWPSGNITGREIVDLELVLLADATGSIDDAEIRFQREGYAAAIIHPDVLSAIASGPHQQIAVTYVG